MPKRPSRRSGSALARTHATGLHAASRRLLLMPRARLQLTALPDPAWQQVRLHLDNVCALAAVDAARLLQVLPREGGRIVAALPGGVRLTYDVEPSGGLVVVHSVVVHARA